MVTFLGILFFLVCVFLILVVLIQKPKGGGLAGAFGGGGGGGAQAAFGAKVGDVLTWFTVGCFVAFLLLAITLTLVVNPDEVIADEPQIEAATPEGEGGEDDLLELPGLDDADEPKDLIDIDTPGDDGGGSETTDDGAIGAGDDASTGSGADTSNGE